MIFKCGPRAGRPNDLSLRNGHAPLLRPYRRHRRGLRCRLPVVLSRQAAPRKGADARPRRSTPWCAGILSSSTRRFRPRAWTARNISGGSSATSDASRPLTNASPRWAGARASTTSSTRSSARPIRSTRTASSIGPEPKGVEDAMVERLFRAYFTEGLDIGDRTVLARLAGEVGLEAAEIAARLAIGRGYRGGQGRDRGGLPHRRHRRALLHHRPALRRDGRRGARDDRRSDPAGGRRNR